MTRQARTRHERRKAAQLSIGMLVAAVGAALAAERVEAQEGPEEIVVTGQRLSLQRSIDAKRQSATISDVVASDDLGRLPDKNTAESLNRLPGLSVSVDQGEGRYVSIRGVSPALNNLTINGVDVGSPEADGGGRPAPLDVIASGTLARIEVVKAQTPDMDGEGVGGTINLVTMSPLDLEGPMFASGSVQLGREELNDESPVAGQVSVGGRPSDTFGWLLSASYSDRDLESRGYYPDDWSELTLNGVTAAVPENSKNNLYALERVRAGFNSTFELAPTDGSRYYFRTFYSKFEEDEERQRYEHMFRRSVTALTPTTGTSGTNSRREQDLRLEEKNKRFANWAIGGENELSAGWVVDYRLQGNENVQTEPNRNWEFRGDGLGPDTWSIDERGFATVTSSAVDPLDPSLLRFMRLRAQDNATDEDGLIAGVNIGREAENGTIGWRFGLKSTQIDRFNDGSQVRYDLGSTDWFASDFGHFSRAFVNTIDGTPFPNMLLDPAAANAFFDANRDNPEYFELDADDTFENEYQSDYDVDEDVLAAYAMATVELERAAIVAGLRFERTSVDARAFERDPDTLTARAVSASGSYGNVLPAVVATFSLRDDLLLRAAWTSSLGRPDYEQIAPISSLERDGLDATLSIGNPDLEAFESTNLDLSIEYYLGEEGLLSAALFSKDIENFIVGRSETLTSFAYNGEVFENFTRATVANANEAKVRGIELNYQQQLTMLPGPWSGLGVGVSLAFLDSEIAVDGRTDELPLTRQPDWTRSISLFYQNRRFSAALSMDTADAFLSSLEDSPETDLTFGEYGRLDFKASYDFADRHSVFLEWQNINDEPTIEYQGGIERQITQFEEYGQTVYLGFSSRL